MAAPRARAAKGVETAEERVEVTAAESEAATAEAWAEAGVAQTVEGARAAEEEPAVDRWGWQADTRAEAARAAARVVVVRAAEREAEREVAVPAGT